METKRQHLLYGLKDTIMDSSTLDKLLKANPTIPYAVAEIVVNQWAYLDDALISWLASSLQWFTNVDEVKDYLYECTSVVDYHYGITDDESIINMAINAGVLCTAKDTKTNTTYYIIG